MSHWGLSCCLSVSQTELYSRWSNSTFLDTQCARRYTIAGMFVVIARALLLPVVAMVSIWRLDRAMVSERWESNDPGCALAGHVRGCGGGARRAHASSRR